MKPPFLLFGAAHLTAIAACISSLVFLVFYLKKVGNTDHRKRDIWIFTVVFLLIETALVGSKIAAGEWTVQYNLPLHLCDISAFTILYALHTRSETAFRLGWFWGTVGGLMALLLPNLQFVDWYFAPFFIWHLFLIAGPVYQLFTDGFTLPYRSIYTAFFATIGLSVVLFFLNRMLGSNYMFVNERISSFEALGLPEFPGYLPYVAVMGLGLFHVVWGMGRWIYGFVNS